MAPKKTAAPKKKGSKKKPDAAELSRDSDIEKVRVEKEVPTSMNREEGDRLSHQLAAANLKIREIDEAVKAYAKAQRRERNGLVKDVHRLSSAIETGKMMKPLKCWMVKDYRTNTLRYVDDAGVEVAPSEAMPAEMRQRELFDEAPAGERVDVDEEEDAEE